MDKRIEENERVKNQIARAYFTLLEQRGIQDSENITIIEITSKAAVSRMAYYRNFTSKSNIVEYYITTTMRVELDKQLGKTDSFWSIDYGIKFFEVMQAYRKLILLLDAFGYSSIILDAFNQANEDYVGDMASSSIDRFNIYFAAGASFNGALIWLKEGCKESPQAMAKSFRSFCSLIGR